MTKKTFQELINEYKEARGSSNRDLAREFNVGKSTIQRWLTGKSQPLDMSEHIVTNTIVSYLETLKKRGCHE